MMKTARPLENEQSNIATFSVSDAALSESRSRCGKIIRNYRIMAGLDVGQLGNMVGYTKSAITNWEAGIRRPEVEAIGKLCRILKIPSGLFFDLPHESSLTKDEMTLMCNYRSLNKFNRRTAQQLLQSLVENERTALREDYRGRFVRIAEAQLPASAGTGMSLDNIESPEYLYVRSSREAYMADEIIAVSGDSMEPTFRHGDMLFVEHTSEIEPGEIGVFVVAGDGYVKEYQKDGLHSHNPKYAVIHPYEDDHTRCVGRVLGIVGADQLATPDEYNVLNELFKDED